MTPQDEAAEPDEPSSPSSIGSLEAIDRVEEDLNRNENSRATGYMGKNSEVTWMQRLQREAEHRSRGLPGSLEPGQSKRQDDDLALHAVNYHLDDLDINAPGPVDIYAVPPREQADHLFEDYLRTVHPFFPIINRPLFTAQYQTFFDNSAQPGDKWLAILNMIFAVGAKHSHLIEAPWCGDEKDHLVYFTRARILSMNGEVLFSHPDLQQVQVEGLIAFYLLSSDQINRYVLTSKGRKERKVLFLMLVFLQCLEDLVVGSAIRHYSWYQHEEQQSDNAQYFQRGPLPSMVVSLHL